VLTAEESWREDVTDITRILNAIEHGDAKATDELLPVVYEELRLLAAQKLSYEKPGQTLQATALVHEAYLRLVGGGDQSWNSRAHFFKAAAEAMRRILIENARRKKTLRYGRGRIRIDLGNMDLALEAPADSIIALDKALAELSETDRVKANLVELRYFAGLTLKQAAEILGLPERTAKRHWTFTRAWLWRRIKDDL